MTMGGLIDELRAALDEDERAIDAYEAHRAAEGQCVNFEGQDPADYTEFDSCSVHIDTYKACRYSDMDFGRRQVAAMRKVLEWAEDARVEADEDPNDPVRGMQSSEYELYILPAFAEAYGIEVERPA